MASRIRACLAPDDPVTWLTRDPAADLRQADTWMLRLVDAPAAIAAPRLPGSRHRVGRGSIIADAARPANSGRWALEVSGGAGSLTRLGDAPGRDRRAGPGRRSASAPAASRPCSPACRSPRCGWQAWSRAATRPLTTRSSSAFCGPAFTIDHF